MRVRDLMSTNIATIEATATCHDAMELMVRRKVRHLPVVAADGGIVGIVTDRDLRHHLFRPEVSAEIGRRPIADLLSSVKLWEMMSSPVISVAPDADLEQAARMMLEDKLGALPVVAHGRVVGIITETDLLRRIVGSQVVDRDVEMLVGSLA